MNTRKTFYIYDSFFMPTGYNHRFFVEKFARGFAYNGYKLKIASKPDQLKEPGFVMIADHPFYYSFGARRNRNGNILIYVPSIIERIDKKPNLLKKINEKIQDRHLKSIAESIKGKNITLIAWFRQNQKEFIDNLGIPVIYTGEYFYSKPVVSKQLEWYNFYKKEKTAMPIEFAADVNPSEIGKGCTNKEILVSYVGNKGYKPELYSEFVSRKDCSIHPTPPYISENERIKIYKKSIISLGLHANINIKNAIVNERVFEALAYGAICLTDNKYAVKATNGLAILIQNKDELVDKVGDLKNNYETIQRLRTSGFDFVRKEGTYYHRAKKFIQLNEELYS